MDGYQFVYDGHSFKWDGAVANVIESGVRGATVWGGLFEINEDHLAALDCHEGYPKSYQRRNVAVCDEQGTTCEAITYYRTGEIPGEASQKYREAVIQGAGDCGLPESYIQTVLIGQKSSKTTK